MRDDGGDDPRGPLPRVLATLGVDDLVDRLAALPSADRTSLLLEVARRSAATRTPAQVLTSYLESRFLRPGWADGRALHEVEHAVLATLPDTFELVVLSPLAPLGAHSAVATVDQDKVVTTVRGHEAAADPTNVLLLEAAARRRVHRHDRDLRRDAVHLAAVQRVVRAQVMPGAQPHFEVLGLVSAGRATRGLHTERSALTTQLRTLVGGCLAVGVQRVRVELTDLTGGELATLVDQLTGAVGTEAVEVVADPDRASGRGYYDGICFKVAVPHEGDWFEVGDGGRVDWTQRLLTDRRERAVISGLGLDRLAFTTRP